MAAEAPLGQFGGDEDLTGPIVLLASEAGRHIRGQTLAIDGGESAVGGEAMGSYQRIVLASRPAGEVEDGNFRIESVNLPVIADGQVLVRNHYLSLDPSMRGRMSDAKSYAAPQALTETMITLRGFIVSEHLDLCNA